MGFPEDFEDCGGCEELIPEDYEERLAILCEEELFTILNSTF